MGGVEPPSKSERQERLQVYRCEVVVGNRWQHRKLRLRISIKVPHMYRTPYAASSDWRQNIGSFRAAQTVFRLCYLRSKSKLTIIFGSYSFCLFRGQATSPAAQAYNHLCRNRCIPILGYY